MTRLVTAALVAALGVGEIRLQPDASGERGFTAAPLVGEAYDAILDADFDRVPGLVAATCPPAPHAACLGLAALSLWWQIQLDPESRALDAGFLSAIDAAIAEAGRLTEAEPRRAEAWFYLGAAYGVRAQWRVLRTKRLAAARDGKQVKSALERALALDPSMHDAEFGIGMYRYYAAVAPAALRFLRMLLLLPGGNRVEGLQQLERAAQLGQVVRSEAQYQIHVIYLWYEGKNAEALGLVLDLQTRYPHNPVFRWIEGSTLDRYLHDPVASLRASERLLALARANAVHSADLAAVNARLNMARQLRALGRRAEALDQLDAIISLAPTRPAGALARALSMRRELK